MAKPKPKRNKKPNPLGAWFRPMREKVHADPPGYSKSERRRNKVVAPEEEPEAPQDRRPPRGQRTPQG